MSARRFSLYHADDGTSLVEFAVLAPFLVLLLIGLVEVGRYAAFGIQVSNAARAGAAYGAREAYSTDDAGMQTAAVKDALPTVVTAVAGHTCTCADGTADAACDPTICSATHMIVSVHVTTTGNFQSLFSYPGIPPSLQINSTATLQVPQ